MDSLRTRHVAVAWALLLTAGLYAAQPDGRDATTPAPADEGSYRYFNMTGPDINARLYADAAARAAANSVMLQQAAYQVNTLPAIMKAQFEESAEYRQAQESLRDAQEAYEVARRKVVQGLLKTDADYRSAVSETERLGKVIAAGNLSQPERYALALRKMDYAATASKIEAEAIEADNKVKDAREKMVAANKKVQKMRSDFEASVRKDSEFLAARKALLAARVEAAASGAYYQNMGNAYGAVLDAYYYKERNRSGSPVYPPNYDPYYRY